MSAAKTQAEPGAAVSLRSWFAEAEAAAAIARQVCNTPFVPDSLKRWQNPDERDVAKRVLDPDGTIAVVSAALLTGQELGLGPMASLRAMDVIKGTPALRALALRALVLAHGHEITVIESTQTRAIVRGCRADGQEQESIWTIDRAKLLGLYPGPEFGQWRKQPQAQLVARATAEVARWIAADAILGMPYTAEELRDGSDAEQLAGDADSDADEGKTSSRTPRKRTTLRALPPPADAPPAVPRITRTQVTALNGVLRALGIRNRADAANAVRQYIDHDIASADELTFDEAARVLEALTDEAARIRAEQDREPRPDDAQGDEHEGSQGDAADE